MNLTFPFLAVTITANVIGGADALEPSVLNEVERALAVAPAETNAVPCAAGDVFATNGLSATDVAIRLVSLQRADGRWYVSGTNFTAEAVGILKRLGGAVSLQSRGPKTGDAVSP